MNGAESGGERKRGLGCKKVRDSQRFLEQVVTGHDAIDEPQTGRLARVECAPRQDQLDGRLTADIAGETLRAAEGRHDSDVDLGLAEGCGVSGQSDMR